MSTIHPQENVHCGDDWLFAGPLNDSNGNPLPLSGAAFVYKIDSLDGLTNFYTSTSVTITNFATASVLYGAPKATTVILAPGTYYDTLYVVLAGNVWSGTVIEGQINAAPQPA